MRFLPLAVLAAAAAAPAAHAATFYFSDTAYLSAADIPTGFYSGGSPTFLEDFQDGSLDGGITASTGNVLLGAEPSIDSVEFTDGVGGTWFSFSVKFSFDAPVTAAALVWTDGAVVNYTFEAFGAGGVSLGSIVRTLGDSSFTGDKGEDRFFGVTDAGGISAISISAGGVPMEIDHVQYGSLASVEPPPPPDPSVVPLPAGLPLLAGAFGLMAVLRRRR
jgi:hypothetical protein